MAVRPIRTPADHAAALQDIAALMDIPEARLTAEQADRLEVLAVLVEDYERQHHNIDSVDPIAAITFMLEQKGLTRAALEPMIGSRGRVSEVLARRRALSIGMIRALSEGLGIAPAVLLQPYPLRPAAPRQPPRRRAA